MTEQKSTVRFLKLLLKICAAVSECNFLRLIIEKVIFQFLFTFIEIQMFITFRFGKFNKNWSWPIELTRNDPYIEDIMAA